MIQFFQLIESTLTLFANYSAYLGKGILTSKNGDIYEGMFYNHKRHGTGTLVYRLFNFYQFYFFNTRKFHNLLDINQKYIAFDPIIIYNTT